MVSKEPLQKSEGKHAGSLGWSTLLDLVLVLLVLVGVKQALLPFSQLYAGPASTFSAMALATFLMHRRGQSWRELGLVWPKNWFKIIGLAGLTMVFVIICGQLMSLVADEFFVDLEYGSRFDHIEGNLAAYIGIMLLVWTHGSFFEELHFRAFAISKISDVLGGRWRGDAAALFLSSAFFGYRHAYYQGVHGALITGASGFAFGVLYLWFGKRNILPLILAHGTLNSLGQTFRFLGIEDVDG